MKNRIKTVLFIGLLAISFTAGGIAFKYLGSHNESAATSSNSTQTSITSSVKDASTTQTSLSSTSNSVTSSSESSTVQTENEVDTKNLTADQLKQWVSAVIKAHGLTNNFRVDLSTDWESYPLATVTNTDAQVDSMGSFRVNDQGELVEAGYYYGVPNEWVIVSKKFMDVSNIPSYEEGKKYTDGTNTSLSLAKAWLTLRPQTNESMLHVSMLPAGTPVIDNTSVVYPENVYLIYGETTGVTNQIVVSVDGNDMTNYPVNIYWWSDKNNLNEQQLNDLANKILAKKNSFDMSSVDENKAQELLSKLSIEQ